MVKHRGAGTRNCPCVVTGATVRAAPAAGNAMLERRESGRLETPESGDTPADTPGQPSAAPSSPSGNRRQATTKS